MTMSRLDFLMMRDELMIKIESILVDRYGGTDETYDAVSDICDSVCDIMDPAGLHDL